MFQVTHAAAGQLVEARRQRGLPDNAGIRLSGDPRPDGLALGLAFAELPAEDDQVMEQDGLKVFVGAELAEPLSSMALDLEDTPDGPRLALIESEDGEPS